MYREFTKSLLSGDRPMVDSATVGGLSVDWTEIQGLSDVSFLRQTLDSRQILRPHMPNIRPGIMEDEQC